VGLVHTDKMADAEGKRLKSAAGDAGLAELLDTTTASPRTSRSISAERLEPRSTSVESIDTTTHPKE
jgi:hypothetical protein